MRKGKKRGKGGKAEGKVSRPSADKVRIEKNARNALSAKRTIKASA